MASIKKHNRGWRVQIDRQGVRKSKVFPTRQEAKDWAANTEYEILHKDEVAANLSFGELLELYARNVSVNKRGARWEIIRIEKLKRDPIASIQLKNLKPAHFADWRDRQNLAPASITREMTLLGGALNWARKERGLISTNPLSDVRRPPKPQPRDRLPTEDEMERMAHSAGADLSKKTARAYHAFLFSCETAMRAGEVCGLTWEHVNLERRVAHLPFTKNGRSRDVPLSTKAVELLMALPEADPVFDLTTRQLDVLWRKLRDKAGVDGLTFHDSRHHAVTRLAKKLDVLDLAKMVGHTDLRILLNVYYKEDPAAIALRLD